MQDLLTLPNQKSFRVFRRKEETEGNQSGNQQNLEITEDGEAVQNLMETTEDSSLLSETSRLSTFSPPNVVGPDVTSKKGFPQVAK